MSNKTLYVRECDLALWQSAQTQLASSISALFAEFLRERMNKMDAFLHVLHSNSPGTRSEEFAVMIAPVGPTGSGRAMNPTYVSGYEQLVAFLQKLGLTHDAAMKIRSKLKTESSVSERADLLRSVAEQL